MTASTTARGWHTHACSSPTRPRRRSGRSWPPPTKCSRSSPSTPSGGRRPGSSSPSSCATPTPGASGRTSTPACASASRSDWTCPRSSSPTSVASRIRWPRRNDPGSIRARQERLGLEGTVVGHDLEPYAKATEALTGVAPVPVAVVGPVELELGEYEIEEPGGRFVERKRARDSVYVPLANTEGGLSISLARGARAAAESGGF